MLQKALQRQSRCPCHRCHIRLSPKQFPAGPEGQDEQWSPPISAPGSEWVRPCPAPRAHMPPAFQPGQALLSCPGLRGATARGPILGSPLRCFQVLQAGGFPAGKGLELLHQGMRLSSPLLTCLVLTPCPEQRPTPPPAPHPQGAQRPAPLGAAGRLSFPAGMPLVGGVAELGVQNPDSPVGASRASRGGAEQAQPRSCHPGKELGWSWQRWASLGATKCLSCVEFVPLGQRWCLGCSAIATQWLCRGWHSGCHL